MTIGSLVKKYHLWDGTKQAGSLLPKVYTVKKLHSVNPQVNADWFETYAELSDKSFEYVWNLVEVK